MQEVGSFRDDAPIICIEKDPCGKQCSKHVQNNASGTRSQSAPPVTSTGDAVCSALVDKNVTTFSDLASLPRPVVGVNHHQLVCVRHIRCEPVTRGSRLGVSSQDSLEVRGGGELTSISYPDQGIQGDPMSSIVHHSHLHLAFVINALLYSAQTSNDQRVAISLDGVLF